VCKLGQHFRAPLCGNHIDMFEQSVAESLVIATLKSVALSHDQMGSMRHVIALAVALLLIVAILVISIAWPELLPWAQKARVVSR
jgi:hypothetical protein